MFSFHKPKIYRSNLGCCICKAKSSSSRFTDSCKYENEFERCFRLSDKRSGEICNACVLLVKRWKKLSPENRLTKHWHHVVDARAGPGTKLTGSRRLTCPSGASGSGSSSYVQPLGSSQANRQDQLAESRGNFKVAANHTQAKSNSDHDYHLQPAIASTSGAHLSSSASGGSSSHHHHHQTTSSVATTSTPSRRFNSKAALAIDTNVSTFTFGMEPSRRQRDEIASQYHYYAHGSSNSSSNYYYQTYQGNSSSGLNNLTGQYQSSSKPQSALNSTAFESVLKRFRQRQQQQQLKLAKRLNNAKQRRQQQQPQLQVQPQSSSSKAPEKEPAKATESTSKLKRHQQPQQHQKTLQTKAKCQAQDDGFRVSALLDASKWRKERICCGIVFRGLNNELAIFPSLIKACGRRRALASRPSLDEYDNELIADKDAPPPRQTKSGSVSSSESSITSGTGSMGDSLYEQHQHTTTGSHCHARVQPQVASRLSGGVDDGETSSGSSSSTTAGYPSRRASSRGRTSVAKVASITTTSCSTPMSASSATTTSGSTPTDIKPVRQLKRGRPPKQQPVIAATKVLPQKVEQPQSVGTASKRPRHSRHRTTAAGLGSPSASSTTSSISSSAAQILLMVADADKTAPGDEAEIDSDLGDEEDQALIDEEEDVDEEVDDDEEDVEDDDRQLVVIEDDATSDSNQTEGSMSSSVEVSSNNIAGGKKTTESIV